MSITLNIIAHELESWCAVARPVDANPRFEDVRLFFAGTRGLREDVLYLCESADDARVVSDAGCFAAYLAHDVEDRAPEAVLSIWDTGSAVAVLDFLLDCVRRYGEWERSMERICLTGGSLQELLDESEAFLQNNVVVLDPALKLLAYTRNIPCDDPITVELIEHGYHTEDNIRKFKLHKRFAPWAESEAFVINDSHEICKYVTVVKSFKTHSSFSLIAVMMCNVAELAPYLLDIFGMLSARIEYYALRDYPHDKPSGNAVDTFLKDLVNGAIEDDASIIERSRFADIPYSGKFCLFYMKAQRDSVPIQRLLADVSLVVAPAKTILADDAVVVLCYNCMGRECALSCVAKACPHNRKTVSQRLDEMLERYDLSCGRSSMFTDLSYMQKAFDQAREAYLIGGSPAGGNLRRIAAHNWKRIVSFDSCGVDYLVGRLSKRDLGMLDSTYAGSVLASLARQDAESNMDNYDFLYAYLANERRTSIVADKLHMHRNNVNYRIRRIEEQFGIDTEDPAVRFDLLLAYRIREVYIRQNAQ